jgi:hypothetical protein
MHKFILPRLHMDQLVGMVVPTQVKTALSKTFHVNTNDSHLWKLTKSNTIRLWRSAELSVGGQIRTVRV